MEFLENLVERKEAKIEEIKELIKKSESVEEVRNYTKQIEETRQEIQEAKEAIKRKKEKEMEERTKTIHGDIEKRAEFKSEEMCESYLDSIEYRKAFAEFLRSGKWTYQGEQRDSNTTGDIGKIIPNTVLKEFIKEIKSYGSLYKRVRKINIQGGVEVPIESLVPTVEWIADGEVDKADQKAPSFTTSIKFTHFLCRAVISTTLVASVTSLNEFEAEIAKLLAEAFAKEFDRIIVNGTGNGQPLGVVNDERVKDSHKISFSETELTNWISWRKKLFANIPLAYRNEGTLLMTANTWESYFMTLKDNNNRPLYSETFNAVNGTTECRFAGREVVLVEPDIIKNFSEANNGDVFMVYMKPSDYVINSNQQLGFKRYYDEKTETWKNKGIAIIDGKLLDANGVFIIKKSVETPQG